MRQSVTLTESAKSVRSNINYHNFIESIRKDFQNPDEHYIERDHSFGVQDVRPLIKRSIGRRNSGELSQASTSSKKSRPDRAAVKLILSVFCRTLECSTKPSMLS